MITLICAVILSFDASFTPEPVAYPAFIPLTYGSYEFNLGQGGGWRRSFVAQGDGLINIHLLTSVDDFIHPVSCLQAFTIRTYGQPYDEFTLEFRQVPEPVTMSFLIMGIILSRKVRK